MKTTTLRFDAAEEKFIKKVTSHYKFKHLSDIKSFYMDAIMRSLAQIS